MKKLGVAVLLVFISFAALADVSPYNKKKRKRKPTATHAKPSTTQNANLKRTLKEKGFTKFVDSVSKK